MAEKREKTYRIIISGRVQGVCFRYFTRRKANGLGIKGYVRNLDDGTVEVITRCSKEKLNELLEFCKKGPIFAKVTGVDVKEEKKTEDFNGFEIRY